MNLLIQFLLRLSFGLAAGMAITSPAKVTSGYFRNNLYVTLGLTTLAAMVSYSAAPTAFWYCVAAAVASYVGAVCWLYERTSAGKISLLLVMMMSSVGAFNTEKAKSLAMHDRTSFQEHYFSNDLHQSISADQFETLRENDRRAIIASITLSIVNVMTSSLLLGLTMAAMLLGHWYLTTPTMELAPLRRLIIAMGVAVALQALVSALGLWGELSYAHQISTQWWLFLSMRWLFGIFGVAILSWMAWQTLNIPNTQSATGILYVAVIGTFVGESMALLLSHESLFPL